MTADAPLYRLRGVALDLGGRRALAIEDLALGSGATAVVGPNGAGKTTLLRLLAFLLAPSAGTIELRGRRVDYRETNLRRLRRDVTLVSQQPYLFRRSVGANLSYGLRCRGRRAAAAAIERALAAVGLHDFAERPAWKLSGGEARRVALARALVVEPAVLLLDEPMAGVDRTHVAVIEDVVRALAERGTAVVLTTHDLNQAYALATSVVSLIGGAPAPAPLVNLLRGTTTVRDGIRFFASGALRIELAGDESAGTVAIDPDAVVLSRAPLASSARNCFPGEVRRVESDRRGMIVTVDCPPPLIAHITRHAYEDLALNVGARVWVSFKSSAVHVLA